MNVEMPRTAGVLLHPSSLPGRFGIGDLGASARAFLDWLARAQVGLWQILPLVPTSDNGSPYSSWSAFAGNPDLIDLEGLCELGVVEPSSLPAPLPHGNVDLRAARATRAPVLARAATRVRDIPRLRDELEAFADQNDWAHDTALFAALKRRHNGAPFWQWPKELRDRDAVALRDARRALDLEVHEQLALQFLFDKQWQAVRAYANSRRIRIVGDIPIYVDGDSVDVWANRPYFELDDTARPRRVAGVPPDAFSETGQRWGNPLYDWQALARDGYAFWVRRMRRALGLCDIVRIDHFRGFAAYWAVPATAPDARSGTWVQGPGIAVFRALAQALGKLPVIAEDLGVIDDQVRGLLAAAELPGMRVLQFAFGGDAGNAYLPHNYDTATVAYTGTHDNDTTLGWWRAQSEHVRHHVRTYLGVDGHDISFDLIRAALASVARFAIVPMQDLLGLGSEARMNTPAVADGNWRWRMGPDALRPDLAERLRGLITLYAREAR